MCKEAKGHGGCKGASIECGFSTRVTLKGMSPPFLKVGLFERTEKGATTSLTLSVRTSFQHLSLQAHAQPHTTTMVLGHTHTQTTHARMHAHSHTHTHTHTHILRMPIPKYALRWHNAGKKQEPDFENNNA